MKPFIALGLALCFALLCNTAHAASHYHGDWYHNDNNALITQEKSTGGAFMQHSVCTKDALITFPDPVWKASDVGKTVSMRVRLDTGPIERATGVTIIQIMNDFYGPAITLTPAQASELARGQILRVEYGTGQAYERYSLKGLTEALAHARSQCDANYFDNNNESAAPATGDSQYFL